MPYFFYFCNRKIPHNYVFRNRRRGGHCCRAEKRTGKPRPVVIELRDATRVEYGITPTQSRNRLDDKIDDIIDTKTSSKVKRFVRKLVSQRKTENK